MNQITPEAITQNVFDTIGKKWLLITAECNGKTNTMTASWGGMGVLWGKKVAFIFIRPQRYTKEFVDGQSYLSLSVLPEEFRGSLVILVRFPAEMKIKLQNPDLRLPRRTAYLILPLPIWYLFAKSSTHRSLQPRAL